MSTDAVFDFDIMPDRNGVGCAKWNRRTDQEKALGVIPMSIADMEFMSPPCVMEALAKMAQHGYFGYTDADQPYYDAVRGWMKRRHDFATENEWIIAVGGVVPALSVAVRAYTEPGDKVLIQSPVYYPFRMAAELNGRAVVESPLCLGADDMYRMDFDDLAEKAKDPAVKMMIFCSPHNPVGRVWTAEELKKVAEICRENGVVLISDEIHCDLILEGKHIPLPLASPETRENIVLLTSPSKTFNLAGLQTANAIIENEKLRRAFRERLTADGYSNNAFFGYHAMIAAYTDGDAWLDALIAYLRENFHFFKNWLEENFPLMRLMPVQGTYLAWTDCRAMGMTDEALAKFVRGDALLFLDEGTMFGPGGEGFLRWNLALPRQALKEAMERMLEAWKRQKQV